MLILKAIDHLQDARRYLIQRHIGSVAADIRTLNGAIALLQNERANAEMRYAEALNKRQEVG